MDGTWMNIAKYACFILFYPVFLRKIDENQVVLQVKRGKSMHLRGFLR